MAAAAEALVRTASGEADAVRGVIRITASDIVSVEVLPPMLVGFHEAYPDVAIELSPSNRQEDLLRRDADIAVRMIRPTQGALVAQRVGAVPLKLYAHRRYIEAHGMPTTLAEAARSAIGFDRDMQIQRFLQERQISLAREAFAFRSDNDLAQLAALRAGYRRRRLPGPDRAPRPGPRPGAGGRVPRRHGVLGRHARGPEGLAPHAPDVRLAGRGPGRLRALVTGYSSAASSSRSSRPPIARSAMRADLPRRSRR